MDCHTNLCALCTIGSNRPSIIFFSHLLRLGRPIAKSRPFVQSNLAAAPFSPGGDGGTSSNRGAGGSLVAGAASAFPAGYVLRGGPVGPCDTRGDPVDVVAARAGGAASSPLGFMKSKLVLLVSHELSLSGGPLLLMELAFLLRQVGCQVVWITNQRPEGTNDVSYSLEHKMLNHGVQVLPARGQEAVETALKADLVILNTAVAGKWLDAVLKDNVPQVLPKILWWIHEMRGHYFKLEYVKHLPLVAGAMIDSHITVEYWKTRTHDRLNIQMPQTFAVHLGNSKELTEVAEDNVARRVLREHIRESLGVRSEDLLFAMINSVSRGKGQDLFLQAFHQSLQLIQHQKLKVPKVHAVVVGSDMSAQTKYETQLRDFVAKNGIHDRVHFINKTLAVAPYLAAIDVLVQNSQFLHIEVALPRVHACKEMLLDIPYARGECFGRITIEAMAFKLPVLSIRQAINLYCNGWNMGQYFSESRVIVDSHEAGFTVGNSSSYTSWVPSIYCFLACIFCRVLDASISQFIDSVLMALQYQGTAAGGTTEIVLDGSTGLLHPAGKEGVTPLAKNMVRLASHVEQRVSMGNKGYARVKERFMEHHMAERIAVVLKEVLHKSQQHPHS
ncbi:hypothetical protein TRIUR3_13738 [Triticum urartu]|uniref:Glycosyl transferase family 1 domain-containing protein n=1 Tax=Triticum urartu TaxID=4572 RepID=M7ZW02_TRIUA|nr:hypothetical protein TRIUR3_13738 [Triticum urartu]